MEAVGCGGAAPSIWETIIWAERQMRLHLKMYRIDRMIWQSMGQCSMKQLVGFVRSALSLLAILTIAALAKQLGLIAVAICAPLILMLVLFGGRRFVNRGVWRIWIVVSLVGVLWPWGLVFKTTHTKI